MPNRGPAPAHWIRPNETTRVPRRHIVIDTEARSTRTSSGETQVFRCAVAAYDHQDRKGTPPQPTQWGKFTEAEALWSWVDARTCRGRRTVLVAHNLGYDLRVGQAFLWLPKLGWELGMIRLDAGQAWATWRNGERSLTMTDSVAWFGANLETVGQLVELGKLELPDQADSEAEWLARCRQDVVILRDAWQRVLRWVEADDLGNWKPTGAGQGWAAFRHRHMTHRILHHGIPEIAAVEREAAWTGRCEAWRWGKLPAGPWFELDYSSAYTQIAADSDVPVRLQGRMSPSECKRFLAPVEGRCALIRCRIDTETPTVPARGAHGILWPVGSFETWLWDVEAREVVRDGGTVRCLGGWSYRSSPALQQWAQWILDLLGDQPDGLDPVLRLVVKRWGRSVVGRFGSRWASWQPYGESHGPDVTLGTLIDGDTGIKRRLLMLGASSFIEGDTEDAPDGAVHVMSWIMAAARCRLLAAMRVAGMDHVAYVDTDGLLVDRAGLDRLAAVEIPGLRVKSAWRTVEVLGPRQLILDGRIRAAGIPARAQRIGRRQWAGEVWRTLPGSLAAGQAGQVTLTDRVWTLRGTDHRRLHLPGGLTAPIRLTL